VNGVGPRIILIGGTYRGLCVLERLLERGERVVAFIGQEGGGERDFCPEILEMCDRHSIPARSAHKLGEELVRWLEDRIRPDLAIAVGIDMEIPVAVGGNTRLGLLEVIDRSRDEAEPRVVLRQRGQDVLLRPLAAPSEADDAEDSELWAVEEMLEAIDEYLSRLPAATRASEYAVRYNAPGPEDDILEVLTRTDQPGENTARLEQEAARYLGADAVLALSSTAQAFALLSEALGLSEGDEVVCPGIGSKHATDALRARGATPIFADVEPGSLTLDPDGLLDGIGPRTRALLISHPFGQPADLAALYASASEAGLEVIEDASAALGARYEESRLGRSPCAAVFRLPLSPGDLGLEPVLLTLSPALAERCAALPPELRLRDGAAELAIAALAGWDDEIAARRAVARSYSSELGRYDAFRVPPTPAGRLPTYASFVLGVTRHARASAEDLHKLLAEAGIETRRLVPAVTGRELGELPAVDQARASSLLLPVHAGIGEGQLDHVLDTLFGYAIG
jgi:dTDP-4-amino-4,6-dideoxygalactose transaminase